MSGTEHYKALTVWQPWATLLADPSLPKWIETRGHRTNVRGRVAIHAAVTPRGFYTDDAVFEGGWVATDVGSYQACYCFRSDDDGTRGDAWMVKADGADPAPDFDGPLPFGAVLGTVDLYDCVPIGGPYSFSTGIVEGGPADFAGSAVIVHHPPLYATPESLVLDTVDGRVVDITDQLPYGDFSPGRWAWLTRDAELFPEPVSAKGRQGWWEWTP